MGSSSSLLQRRKAGLQPREKEARPLREYLRDQSEERCCPISDHLKPELGTEFSWLGIGQVTESCIAMHIGVSEHHSPAEGNKQQKQNSTKQGARVKGIAGYRDAQGDEQIDPSQYDGAYPPEQVLRESHVRKANQFLRISDQLIL